MNIHGTIMDNISISNMASIINDSSQEHCVSITMEESHIAHHVNISSAAICCLIFLIGTTVSGYLIWVKVYRLEKTFRSVLSLNLFISGFIWSLFLLLNIVYFSSDVNWPFGTIMCQINNFMFHLNMFISAFILTLYSIDYYFVIMWTFRYSYYRTPFLASLETLVAWVMAFFFSIPYFVFQTTYDCHGMIKCLNRFNDKEMTDAWKRGQEVIGITALVIGYLFPLLIIFVVLFFTVTIYHRKKTSEFSPALKQIFTFQILFGVCWLPYHVFSLMKLFLPISGENNLDGLVEIVRPFTISLASLGCCVNPIVFIFLSPDMKLYLQKPHRANDHKCCKNILLTQLPSG